MADDIAAALVGIALPVPSDKHRWLFVAITAAMLLTTLLAVRTLLRIFRDRGKCKSVVRALIASLVDLVFVAAVGFAVPRFSSLSWGEILAAAPDVAWWLIIMSGISLATIGARHLTWIRSASRLNR